MMIVSEADRSKIMGELTSESQAIDLLCEALVVVSGPPDDKLPERSKVSGYNHLTLNRTRVEMGVEVWNQMENKPYFVIDGEEEVIDEMYKHAVDLGIPADHIVMLPCGNLGEANTISNMEAINKSEVLSDVKRLTFVTSREHVARLLRLASMELHYRFILHAIPMLSSRFPFITFWAVIDELNKIIKGATPGEFPKTSPLLLDPTRLVPTNDLTPFNLK